MRSGLTRSHPTLHMPREQTPSLSAAFDPSHKTLSSALLKNTRPLIGSHTESHLSQARSDDQKKPRDLHPSLSETGTKCVIQELLPSMDCTIQPPKQPGSTA